jgi:type I restriction enzyme S subunit
VDVPSEWEATRVKYVIQGLRAGDAITAAEIESSGEFPVYGGNGLRGYTTGFTHDGTYLLIGRQGALCGNVHLVDRKFWASEHAMVGAASADVDARWLTYLLRAMDLGQYSVTAAQPGIGVAQVQALDLYCPPLAEQWAIADFLDEQTSRIDTLIGKQTQLIDTLRERRSASVTAELLEAAAGAPEDKLSRRAKIGNGSTPRRETTDYWNGGDFPWLNSAVVNARRVCGSDQFVTALARRECHLPTVRPGAVLVGLTGQGRTRGMATILEIEATVSQHVAYVQPDPAFWNSEFLYWSLGARYDELRRMSDENGSTKGGLTCFDLARLRVGRPGMSRQEVAVFRIADQTSRIDALIVKAEEFIGLARERRAALITAAVTGQIDVRTAGRAATVGA